MNAYLNRLAIVAVIVSLPCSVLAGGLGIAINTDGTANWSQQPPPIANPDGTTRYVGSWTAANGLWACTWDITSDEDPFVSANYSVTNTTGVPHTYTVTTVQPIAPAIMVTTYGGSTGGSVTDADFNGIGGMNTVSGLPFYQAYLDATPVLSLYNDPYATPAFPYNGATVNIAQTSAGLPGPTIPGGPVVSSISIVHKFTLSPGDSIAFTSFFVVTPEPGSALGLLALGGLAAIRRRR